MSAADEVRATLGVDSAGEPLTGARRYELRFEAGQAPPVHGFWSLTSRATDASPTCGRLNSDDGLTTGTDGCLSIRVQPQEPLAREQRSNWLPTPAGAFRLVLRLFWPRTDVLATGWSLPPVTRVS
jgi:hypothetical protein